MHPLSKRFHQILQGLGELHDKKQQDYGSDTDPFANVRGAAEEWGLSPWKAAMVRASDKMHRIQSYAKKGRLSNEGVEDSFRDLAVYAVIALVLWEQEVGQEYAEAIPEYEAIPTPVELGCNCLDCEKIRRVFGVIR